MDRPQTPDSIAAADPRVDRLVDLSADGSLEQGLAADGWLRWAAVDLGDVVEEARASLDLSPVAAAALGRSMAAAVLLLRMATKTPSRLVLEIRGDGPLGRVLVETDDRGLLRGSVAHRLVDVPLRPDGKLAVGAAVGSGLLRVVRERDGGSYASQVELVSGEIGLDVAHFLQQSEQTPSAVLLGVLTRPAGVAGAGGLILEALPGAPETVLADLEERLLGTEGVSWLLDEGGLERVRSALLDPFAPQVQECRAVHHRCRCDRRRLGRHLAVLSSEELEEMTTAEERVEGECVFCGSVYCFGLEELTGAG